MARCAAGEAELAQSDRVSRRIDEVPSHRLENVCRLINKCNLQRTVSGRCFPKNEVSLCVVVAVAGFIYFAKVHEFMKHEHLSDKSAHLILHGPRAVKRPPEIKILN
jgi:hypothetical protein